jgi:hypothetical protein
MRAVTATAIASLMMFCGPVLGSALTDTNPWQRYSQVPAQQEPVATSRRSVNLTEENRHMIREIVLKGSKVSPEIGTAKLQIGDIVPTSVTTYDFPEEVSGKITALKAYRYFIRDDSVVIVEANESKVADVVKRD